MAALPRADGPPGVGRVLTPHAGEMAEIESDPLAAACEAAARFSAVVVMKGSRSHVVAPDERAVL